MKRKDFLKVFAVTAAASTVVLSACGDDPKVSSSDSTEGTTGNTTTSEPTAAKADCNDLSGLSEADIKQRESVSYVELSTDAEKNCTNCRFFKAAEDGSGCGSCQLIKGPVSPEGNCKSWFKKDA